MSFYRVKITAIIKHTLKNIFIFIMESFPSDWIYITTRKTYYIIFIYIDCYGIEVYVTVSYLQPLYIERDINTQDEFNSLFFATDILLWAYMGHS